MPLTTQEFELLSLLAHRAGELVSRDEVFRTMRGIDYDGLDRSIDGRVSKLRRKLGDDATAPTRIKTVWGKGYLLVPGRLGDRGLKEWLAARHRGLFIRSYVVLAGGLLVAAILLDLGFAALAVAPGARRGSLARVHVPAHGIAARRRVRRPTAPALAQSLADEARCSSSTCSTRRISRAPCLMESGPRELEGDDGKIYYLWNSEALNGAIRLGPFEPPRESAVVRFLPVLFYASILLIVGLWLRPLLRDLRVLTVASQKFATDYREPLDTASRTTQLTSLATNLDDMSAASASSSSPRRK